MNLSSDSYHFSDWRSSFDDHPQYAVLKGHVERAVQDLFLEALKSQSEEFVYIFSNESQIDDFCTRMCSYWENEENYETCGEILALRGDLKKKWSQIPKENRGKDVVIREWLKSSF